MWLINWTLVEGPSSTSDGCIVKHFPSRGRGTACNTTSTSAVLHPRSPPPLPTVFLSNHSKTPNTSWGLFSGIKTPNWRTKSSVSPCFRISLLQDFLERSTVSFQVLSIEYSSLVSSTGSCRKQQLRVLMHMHILNTREFKTNIKCSKYQRLCGSEVLSL